QCQLVVVPQKKAPLARGGNIRRFLQDIDHGLTVLQLQGHEHSRHQRKVESHMKLVTLAEIGAQVRRPLIRFRQEEATGVGVIKPAAQELYDLVCRLLLEKKKRKN